jgi:glycosyltransferase involved in cell wall biosynthesis
MRVLHVYSGNLYGGIETILTTIACAQTAHAGAHHEFALCFEGRLGDELGRAGAVVHKLAPVRLSRPHTASAARRALSRLLGEHQFDCVICHAPWSQAIFGAIVRRAGVPLAFWAHDVMTGTHWTERLARRTVPDLAISNSEFTAGTLPCLYPSTRAVVIYAPVELPAEATGADAGATAARIRADLRASLDTPGNAVVIVQASRAEAWKGHKLLVDALAGIRDNADWMLWMAGGAQRPAEDDFLEEVRELAAARGIAARVRWLGQRSDVREIFSSSDLYCQANLSPEPFGVVFVEALASRLPVVATALGGAREIVTEKCGVLVAPDAHDLGGAIRALVVDARERARLGAAGPARARELCDPGRQLTKLVSALAELPQAQQAGRA